MSFSNRIYGFPILKKQFLTYGTSIGYDPKAWLRKIKRDLAFAGFNATVTWNDRKIVHTGWIRIAELMRDAGLTDLPKQKISIKLEIDTKPPAGAILEIGTRYSGTVLAGRQSNPIKTS